MRALLIFSFTLITLTVYSQIFSKGDPKTKGKVDFIMERSDGYKNDWREYSFDSLSRIVEIKYYRDKELLENHFLSYKTINDSECVLGGIRSYSKFRRDKYEVKYKYDKMGNWNSADCRF